MAIHYFHCTDGRDLIVDRRGSDAPSDGAAAAQARRVAAELMAALPGHDEWAGWAVHVYDAWGELAVVPFVEEDRSSPRAPDTRIP